MPMHLMLYLSNSQDEDCDAEGLVEITEEHAYHHLTTR